MEYLLRLLMDLLLVLASNFKFALWILSARASFESISSRLEFVDEWVDDVNEL